jgi:nitrite reductase/ring-hydroxylating ferredoxin subunit
VVSGVGLPLLAACGGDDSSGTPAADGSGSASGGSFATTADVPEGGGAIFADEGVIVTQPAAGEFKGFTNVCTHRQCPLASVTDTINCNCHGSRFSIEDGSPVNGPATVALADQAITVDGDEISLG